MNTIALAGNPNSGKTTLFNALTGSNQHVGNWPGVTVEKKEGKITYNNNEYNIVDLPGTYSLGAYSEDEVVARDYILKEHPDIVINVVDATSIERNLYLTTQLLEMGTKVVLALNMMDEAKAKDIQIDLDNLSKNLGIPVVATVASKNEGLDELLKKSTAYFDEDYPNNDIDYGENIHQELDNIRNLLNGSTFDYPTDWIAMKLLEGDQEIIKYIETKDDPNISNNLDKLKDLSSDYEFEIVDKRYDFIGKVVQYSIVRPTHNEETLTDKIDRIVTHKFWGLPIFAFIMFAVFQLTFAVGEDILGEFLEDIVETVGQ